QVLCHPTRRSLNESAAKLASRLADSAYQRRRGVCERNLVNNQFSTLGISIPAFWRVSRWNLHGASQSRAFWCTAQACINCTRRSSQQGRLDQLVWSLLLASSLRRASTSATAGPRFHSLSTRGSD